MNREIYTLNQYGSIELTLKEIMDSRNISRNALARAINTRFEVVDKWYQGHIEKIDTDILARICYVLDCSPSDVIKYRLEK